MSMQMDATTSILTLMLLMIVSLICPVLVFINSKSGDQVGGDLLCLLNHNQVFDLGEDAPDKKLRRIYLNMGRLKSEGNEVAEKIEATLRIIVAGGDGTAGWLLGVVCDLKLSRPPPITTVPLGTGNNLPFAFAGIYMLRMRAPKEGSCDPIAPVELPHSLHVFQDVSSTHEPNMEGYHTFCGEFWNGFSMGMDAQVSYAVHSERKLRPEKFKNQLVNLKQSTYAKLGCTQGWFAASLFHPASKSIAQLAKEKIMKIYGQWQDLHIPHRKTILI